MNLEAIEKRCEAATPGPWEEKTNRHPQCNGEPWGWISGAAGNITWSGNAGKSNASFIAHARSDIPALIAEVKALTAQIAEKTDLLNAAIAGQETLQKALAERYRREKTEVEDLKYYLQNNEENGVVYVPKFVVERIVNQRGPQETGEGEAEE